MVLYTTYYAMTKFIKQKEFNEKLRINAQKRDKQARLKLEDKNTNQQQEHYYEGGLSEFVKHLNKKNTPLFETPVHIKGEKENVPVELALSYNETYSSNILTFVKCLVQQYHVIIHT